jgi:Flp pilus assembly CpaE family ATPase
VLLHAPRALDGLTWASLDQADRVIEVLSLDVMSFRAATRAIEALESADLKERTAFVVNRAARGEVTPADVRRVFGEDPVACIPLDRSVSRAQDRGRLLPRRGRIGRAFDRLAAALTPPGATAATAGP